MAVMKDFDRWHEKIMATLDGIAASQKESSAKFDREMAEERAARAKSAAEFDQRMKAEEAARAKAAAEFDQRMKEYDARFGGFTGNYADSLEEEFFLAAKEDMRIGDIPLKKVRRNVGTDFDFDIAGMNGEFAVACEIKNRLTKNKVVHFAEKRLPYFAADCASWAKGRKVLGMVGGKRIEPDAKDEAEKRGLIVLRLKNKKLIAENADKARPIAQR